MRCTTNYSSRLQQFGIFVCLGLLLAAAGAQRAVADDASVTVSTTSTDQIVLPGTAVTVDASAMFVAPTTPARPALPSAKVTAPVPPANPGETTT